jgi:hypothetical protein
VAGVLPMSRFGACSHLPGSDDCRASTQAARNGATQKMLPGTASALQYPGLRARPSTLHKDDNN